MISCRATAYIPVNGGTLHDLAWQQLCKQAASTVATSLHMLGTAGFYKRAVNNRCLPAGILAPPQLLSHALTEGSH